MHKDQIINLNKLGAKGCSERQIASILKILITSVHKKMIQQQTLGTTTSRGAKNDYLLTAMNSSLDKLLVTQ